MRDDGQTDRPKSYGGGAGQDGSETGEGVAPVLNPRDERHRNAPDTLNADKGAAEIGVDAS